MEIVTSWMERGIEQGELRGEQKEALRLVRRLLNRQVGDLDAGLNERLQQRSVTQLEELHDAALDFTQMSDLIGWLDANS